MADETPAVETVMLVLSDHGPDFTVANQCRCGAVIHDESQFRQHVGLEVVAALDPVMRKAKAEAHDEGHITACPVKGCEGLGRNPYRIEAAVSDRHDPTWFHAGRYGRWCQCTCGWKSLHGTPIVAQLAFGTHLLDVRDA